MYRSNQFSKSSSRLITSRCWSSTVYGKNVTEKPSILKRVLRHNSTSSTKSGAGNGVYLGASVATIGLLGVGAAVYAKYDDNFRSNIEKNLPFTKDVFTSFYGELQKKNILLPVEKDLSIPFQASVEKEALMEESLPSPLFGDDIKFQPSDNNFLALNTLDTPGVSAIDLELSDRPKSSEIDSPSAPLFDDCIKSPSSDSDFLALNTLDTPGVSAIDLELSDLPKSCEKDENTEVSTDTNEEAFVMIDSENIPAIEDGGVISDTQSAIDFPAIENTVSEDSLPLDGPLTSEEIKLLSEVVNQSAMEVVLDASADHLKLISDITIQAQKKAADSIRAYTKQLSETVFVSKDNEHYETVWKVAAELEKVSQDVIDQAKAKAFELKDEVMGLKELMTSVRESGYSELADKTEELLSSCDTDLTDADSEIAKAESELKFFLDFEEIVRNAPAKLKDGLKNFTPDLMKLLAFNKEEIQELPFHNALLALALKRPEIVSSEVNEEKIAGSIVFENLLEKQREEITKLSEEKLATELKRVEEEKRIEQKLKVHELEETYEKEMLSQLKRQASAHNAHLSEVLDAQSQKLTTKHQNEINTKLTEQQQTYEFKLEKNVAAIHGIQSKISDVADVGQRQRSVQELWIASQALNSAIEEGLFHGRTRTLMPEMLSIIHIGGGNGVLQEIVESVPEAAAMFGVIPEKDLIHRFKHVKKVCKKVALIDEQGGSVGTYLISYIKSLFVYSGWYQRNIESSIDLDELGPYEILAKAEYFIQEGDLEQAAKFMSQLKGAARKMSSDWMNEVRLLLETKQTAQLLIAYAAALNAGTD